MLPLTVLAGLSTTLRDELATSLVASRPRSLAVLHDTDRLVAGSVVRRRVLDRSGVLEEEDVTLEHPCLACAVREDVLPTLDRLAGLDRWAEVLLGLPSALEPAGPVEAVEHGGAGGGDAGQVVRTDTVTTVVDAVLLRELLSGDDLPADRGLAAAADDRRSVAEVMTAQIEYADVVAVAGVHRVDDETASVVRDLVHNLSPQAEVVDLDALGGVDAARVMSTGRFDHASACARTEPGVLPALPLQPRHGAVPAMVWSAHRPLHPGRLQRVLGALVDQAVRTRGRIWLVDRPGQRVAWESAGRSIRIGDVGDWRGPRSCQLALTGPGLDPKVVRGLLDGCLVTEHELAHAAGNRNAFPDPFAEALGPRR